MRRLPLWTSTVLLAAALGPSFAPAADVPADRDFLAFVRAQAELLRASDPAPTTRDEWLSRRAALRKNLLASWGGFPENACPLQPRVLGQIQRDGYRVEKIVFQTLPDVWMTANAYVPNRAERLPAVLCVHGHWARAKQDPVVQSRCIGLAKLGFFVLVVDAFGAGERAVGKALGEYHGEMTGALLLPIGRPLAGIQVYENIRAVDYLCARPEVDPSRIGITGASGGGNQSMYAGTYDERFAAAVPVCSVGTYRAYLGAACCMCEVVPGALTYTEEGDLLGLTAPRGLMVINATRDARQFSVEQAQQSLARAEVIFRLYDRADRVRHTVIDSAHDYNRPMREAMYGWMTRHLKNEGDGAPVPEPAIETADPESLRCFPGESRPDDYITIPRFAAAEGRRLLAARASAPNAPASLDAARRQLAQSLNVPLTHAAQPLDLHVDNEGNAKRLTYLSEPGMRLSARLRSPEKPARDLVLLLDLSGAEAAEKHPLAVSLSQNHLVTLDLRATGKISVPGDAIGQAPDHNSAEWALWIGRPLLGQWVHDVRRTLDAVGESQKGDKLRIGVVGIGPAGLVALSAAALDQRIEYVQVVDTLASFISDKPYRGQRLGTLVPGLVRDVGDVGHLAALVAPRPLTVTGGVLGDGSVATADQLRSAYLPATREYATHNAATSLRLNTER